MSIFTCILIACAAMCVVMAIGVALDSKLWNLPYGNGGWFEFIHPWVGWICIPMMALVFFGSVFYTMFVPLEIDNDLLRLFARALLGYGILCASFYVFLIAFIVIYCVKKNWISLETTWSDEALY